MSTDLSIGVVVLSLCFLAYSFEVLQDWWFNRKIVQGIDFEDFPHEANYSTQLKWVSARMEGPQTLRRAGWLIEEFFYRFPMLDKDKHR